jgi:imidazolonepropionase-like amidohydrolase
MTKRLFRGLSHVGVVLIAAFSSTSSQAARPEPPFTIDPYPSTYQPLPRADTLIVDVTILDGVGGRMDQGEILLRDGRIAAVGHGLSRDNVTVVQGKGRWVTPGIIDVHSHNGTYVLPLTSLDRKASDVSETSDPNVADTWVEHAVNPQDPAFAVALRSGVTTIQVLPGSTPLFAGRSVVVKPLPATNVRAMKFPGAVQALKMSCGENAKSFFGDKDEAPNSRQGEIAIIREALLRAQEYREEWRQYSRGKSKKAPQRDLKLDTLAAVLDGDIPVHMHCYRASDMSAMIGVAQEFGFKIAAFHHATEAYKIPAELKQAGTCVAVWSDWWGFKMELQDSIRENAAMSDAAGVCTMMHSDSPVVGQRLQIEAAKAAGAGRRVGLNLPPEHVITWVTSVPAKVLRLGDRIGTIAPGFNADLVLWSGDPFSIYTKADRVFIDGAQVYDSAEPARSPASDFGLGRPEMGGRQ